MPGAHLSHGAKYVVKGGDENLSDHRQRVGDMSAGENQKTERKKIWSLVLALPCPWSPHDSRVLGDGPSRPDAFSVIKVTRRIRASTQRLPVGPRPRVPGRRSGEQVRHGLCVSAEAPQRGTPRPSVPSRTPSGPQMRGLGNGEALRMGRSTHTAPVSSHPTAVFTETSLARKTG